MPLPYYKFWWQRWMASSRVKRLTMEEQGYYLALLNLDWAADGLPEDLDELMDLLPRKATEDRIVSKIRDTFFAQRPDGTWSHDEMESQREETAATSERNRAKALKRWADRNAGGNAAADAPAMPQRSRGYATRAKPTPSPTPAIDPAPEEVNSNAASAAPAGGKPRPVSSSLPAVRADDRTAGAVDRIVAHYSTHRPRPAKVTAKRRKLVAARLKEGFKVDDLCRAIDGYFQPWTWNAQQGGSALALDLMLRDAGHVEKGLEMMDGPQSQVRTPRETQTAVNLAGAIREVSSERRRPE